MTVVVAAETSDLVVPAPGVDPDAHEAAVAAVRAYCGWHIAPVLAATVVLDGPASDVAVLPTLRLVDVVGLNEDGLPLDPFLDFEWSASGYLRKALARRWTGRLRGIEVNIRHGFPVCPPEVKAVVRSLARASALSGVAGQTTGPFGVTYTDGASAGALGVGNYEAAILARYRLPSLT